MTPRVFIDGAVGTTGIEIHDRLVARPDLVVSILDDELRKDTAARRDALNTADVVILCLPDEAARDAVALIENATTRVIDASTAHRTASGWTYGFAEIIGHQAIRNARFVSNPGCYATGFIALIAPLVRAGVIPADWALTCNAVSGFSGGGKTMIAQYEAGAPSAHSSYALGLAHKHVPEMRLRSGLSHAPLFVPAVSNCYRGMLVDVPLALAAIPHPPEISAIHAAYAAVYGQSPIVQVDATCNAATLTIESAANTDRLELHVFTNPEKTQIRLVAALDNLGKGAAGAAVQNLNIMLGLDETTGLHL